MSLSAAFRSIASALPPGVRFYVGPEHVNREESPPRIVIVPTRELYGAPRGHGGDTVTNPRALRRREVNCSCHLWAFDYDGIDQLLVQFDNALQASAYGCVLQEGEGGEWRDQSSTERTGRLLVVDRTIIAVIPRVLDRSVIVTSLPTVLNMNFPDGQTAVNP